MSKQKSRKAEAAPVKDTRYNGWTNYETWNVALWLGNDQGSGVIQQGLQHLQGGSVDQCIANRLLALALRAYRGAPVEGDCIGVDGHLVQQAVFHRAPGQREFDIGLVAGVGKSDAGEALDEGG